jgi:hypothetical protein
MKIFEKNTSYTIADLKSIAGDSYHIFLSSYPTVNIPDAAKPVIYNYNDFDAYTKSVYTSLNNLISSMNPNSDFLLFAVGDRVNGTWRTNQEILDINDAYNLQLQQCPYEYASTAAVLPSTTQLGAVSCDTYVSLNMLNNTHRVIIPPHE